MKRKIAWSRLLLSLYRYLVFFLLIAFLITCCLLLFTKTLTATAGVVLTRENLTTAAGLTFLNVLLLSLICTLLDLVRRKLTVDRPVRRITEAAQRITAGDFSVRIPPLLGSGEAFNEIIACFNKMAEELAGMESLRTDLIANVSHELKTPLAVMGNYATLLQQPNLPEEQRKEYAKAVAQATRRLGDLISNILKLNKLENQQIFPTVERYDLGEQLALCLLGFEELWEAKQLEIETDLEDGVMVSADPELLSLVWNNLLSNAIKFTGQGGRISLSLHQDGQRVVVRVSDTGCGISPEVGARIFDKFYQGDTSHAAQGNGLGLALVKRVMDITSSDIAVESQPGKGSTFTVTLRRSPDGTAQTGPR